VFQVEHNPVHLRRPLNWQSCRACQHKRSLAKYDTNKPVSYDSEDVNITGIS